MSAASGQESASLIIGKTRSIGYGWAARLGCGGWVAVKTQPKTHRPFQQRNRSTNTQFLCSFIRAHIPLNPPSKGELRMIPPSRGVRGVLLSSPPLARDRPVRSWRKIQYPMSNAQCPMTKCSKDRAGFLCGCFSCSFVCFVGIEL